MICELTRWLISRSQDTGKKMPAFAVRHLKRCGSCRDFARFAESLPARFTREFPSVLSGVPEAPPFPIPAETNGERSLRPPGVGIRRFLRPVPAAALALALLAGIFFFRPTGGGPGRSPDAALTDLKSLIAVSGDLPSAAARAESPLVREQALLENSVLSAYEYLQARLNIKIERKESRST